MSLEHNQSKSNCLVLFDVDGTLCKSGQEMADDMAETLRKLKSFGHTIGLIGGGTYDKIHYQTTKVWDLFEFACCENGQYTVNKKNEVVHHGSIRDHWGTNKLTKISTELLRYNIELCLPVKTGKFIDLRSGLLYWTPIGQNCTPYDRQSFKILDQMKNLRLGYIQHLKTIPVFQDLHLSLGGELGIAITPPGWDKSFPYFNKIILTDDYLQSFDEVIFFGDKMGPDGSDAPMKKVPGVECIEVQTPEDCQNKLCEMFGV